MQGEEALQSKWSGFITGNQLKIIALVAMTCDHVGKELLPQFTWLQIIGRLAFPIFAYMIAEGCLHTKNRRRYLFMIGGLALACQVVYFAAMGSLYQSVLVTFTLAILLIYFADWVKTHANPLLAAIAIAGSFGLVWFVSVELPVVLWRTDYNIDYGFAGILLVVGIYYAKGPWAKLLTAAGVLIVLGLTFEGIQWYGLLALPLLALYSGRRGKQNLKYLFYIYYPVHLVCIYLISLMI